MSTSSNASLTRRIAKRGKSYRGSTNKLPHVSRYDAYTYALRAAYLHHLLQPKARRLQHEPLQSRPHVQRSTTNVTDLVRDSFIVRDSKSTRLPHGFMAALEKRLTGILYGQEKMPEYTDSAVRNTFAVFFNEFRKPEFRRAADKDRRMEDLLLIFFSNATKQLMKTKKSPEDDSWKLMVDRHVALFVRLASSILKANDWAKEKPELASRLQTLESKLLTHDKDLAAASQRNDGQGGTTVEVDVPRSQFVKDMPMVQTVAAVFEKDLAQAQGDIDDQKEFWTEKAALRDLKMYQTSISLKSRQTLRPDDFDTDTAYEAWRKVETQDLSQLVLAIIQSSPALAKTTAGTASSYKTANGASNGPSQVSSPINGDRRDGTHSASASIDIRGLSLSDDPVPPSPAQDIENDEPYMFIPPDSRAYYRQLLMVALTHDTSEGDSDNANGNGHANGMAQGVLRKSTIDMLQEIGARWRVPRTSRLILFKDAIRELLAEQKIDYDTLDNGLVYAKNPPWDKKQLEASNVLDPTQWPLADFILNQQTLAAIHDTLLRDLFEQLQQCYNVKPPEIAPIMAILESHVYDDPLCNKKPQDQDDFSEHLREALRQKAEEIYSSLAQQHLGKAGSNVEFFHVIQLGQAVFKQAERIQKRYRRASEIMGAKPAVIFIEIVLPAFAADARDHISSILDQATAGEDIPIEDGFELYKAMAEMRSIHNDVLPNVEFAFHVENLLAPFVWRWITSTEQSMIGWVEAAVRQDTFQVRSEDPSQPPSQDERHSVSVIDIFQSFNQVIDRIVELSWDDDYQYAKFMTALAKSVGAGIARYCEQIERFFISEMDRLTPEQVSQLKQTRQERWVQLARDALSATEKMEPYQFLPESLVKLNNTEWAMQQLDFLERKIKVDACADEIQKREPPPPPGPRKNEKLVFTVKIIEAEDLKACDSNGLSDPYVVLGDEYQKRLAKTRVIQKNLNPRWEETVDISTQGPLNVIATVWDWDILGDHNCVGRTSIKLDPAHFRDFLPREYWLDLDTQGRLLVRVSMEGEKDDIRFYFGKAFRTLKRTERDMTRKITDKLTTYIQFALSRRTLKNLTTTPLSINTVSSYFQRNRPPPTTQKVSELEITEALQPLFKYFDDNFAIMNRTLTKTSMKTVMGRLWKETLSTLESLLVPPLSDKPSAQRQLTEQEVEIVFRWLTELFAFFHADGEGVPLETLRSPKYHDLKNLNFFYYEPTNNLIRESERMTVASADRQRDAQARANRTSAPGALSQSPNSPLGMAMSFGGAGSIMGLPSTRRSKTVMHSRNLGTMRKAKEEKRREAQAEPSDDMILRILRMRPEAERYLRDRSRQKERLAAHAAAEMIVRQSLAAGAARDRATGAGRGYTRGR